MQSESPNFTGIVPSGSYLELFTEQESIKFFRKYLFIFLIPSISLIGVLQGTFVSLSDGNPLDFQWRE